MRAPTGGVANSTKNFPRARRGTPHRESRPSEAGFLASGKAGDRWGLAFVAGPPRAGRANRTTAAARSSTPGQAPRAEPSLPSGRGELRDLARHVARLHHV